ncbi:MULTISPECIES: acetyl-CoA C-acetyltransferase [Bacillus]|uniref:acetyl-CoA C-acetyltransferase n=1 Tax=Bacillus atrophaeus (strain 1942) TaxID=720555 RepID=A0ABM5LYN8_BACA1|nr:MULTISPECIES: acetyl-CoA C-acetyltransferase [Bacillus]AMR62209.1 acetyl-CoA acetyltransferase [Bacillus subtilis subsp. globigii]ADP33009.1 degradative acetoacetyl-CoA thiolase [Bacillus atrophaeus 1942]AIK47974.1 acetyl-CoA C-acetyltransferase family protein [Bacillus atrophaeus subsp. globigii]ASS71810.1 acetyl-CoA acetyltransferase [Bacillus atrophaeus]EIM12203.1 degradative acetoacetyl-CoA thiolase [Bacillus atrophaeus C89]
MTKTVIVSAARTPFGKFGGALKELKAAELGGIAIKEALNRAGINGSQADEVIMGMVVQAGAGQIPSRQAARLAEVPWEVPTETINKVCASGLRAVTLGDQIIRAQDGDILVAGGMESMSNIPYAVPAGRWGARMGDAAMQDLMVYDGLTCAFDQVHMAVHGNTAAEEYGITRKEQDEWALRSQKRAAHAIDEGKFKEEIVPVAWVDRKGKTKTADTDEGLRRETSLEQLAKLPPIYSKEGSVTAGNAPGVNDGAGAFVLMSEEKAAELGKKPLATILGFAAVGQEASCLAAAPGLAINKLLKKTGFSVQDIDLFEVNEAFASVALTCEKIVGWDREKVNVNGGAIALGHPIGASGARILMTLIYELKRRGGGLGIAAICSGAAQGDAILIRVH